MRRALPLLVLLSACGEQGVIVDISAKSDVPQLDELRIEAVQSQVLVEQTYKLGDQKLPQSVAVVSKGMTRGTVEITVQGLAAGRVEAVAHVTTELKPASGAQHVKAELERLCPAGGAGCGCSPRECGTSSPKHCGLRDDLCGGKRDCGGCVGPQVCENGECRAMACKPKTCSQLGAACGLTLDGCDRTIDCGRCDAGLNCGGGGNPNACGPGPCTKRTQCDAGMECGSISDGCGDLLSCGSCPAMGVCGSGGVPFRCPCVPQTTCPPSKQCGAWPNGCGGMLNCGACTLPQTCMGGGVANQCGCTPLTACSPLICGTQPNGCGGVLICGSTCPVGRTCTMATDGGLSRCECSSGLSECDGGCVDVSTNAQNCGACGRSCFGGQTCWNGTCPCVDAGSNLDGHCCPPGWFLQGYLENPNTMRCFKGPFDAGTEAMAVAQCRAETDAGYGRALPALGSAAFFTPGETAAPFTACGSYLLGANNQVIDAEAGVRTQTSVCAATCMGASCACTTCPCSGTARACAQRYYCTMDPLAPRVQGPCVQSGECPPGMSCQLGACVDAGLPACVVDADCLGFGGTCQTRGGSAQTGLCQ